MRTEIAALALALLAKWRPPAKCTIPDSARDDEARSVVADYLRGQDFRRFVEDAAAGGLRARSQVPVAILGGELRARVGAASRVMPIQAGTPRHGARHIWMRHGPDSTSRAWKRLTYADWLQVQRLLDEAEPVRQRDGRWTFTGGAWARAGGQRIGFRLVAEIAGGELTPITFFRRAAG